MVSTKAYWSSFCCLLIIVQYEDISASNAGAQWNPQLKVNPYSRSLYLMPMDRSHQARSAITNPSRIRIVANSESVLKDEAACSKKSEGAQKNKETSQANSNRITTTTPELLFSGGGAAVMTARRGGNHTDTSTVASTVVNRKSPDTTSTKMPTVVNTNNSPSTIAATATSSFTPLEISGDSEAGGSVAGNHTDSSIVSSAVVNQMSPATTSTKMPTVVNTNKSPSTKAATATTSFTPLKIFDDSGVDGSAAAYAKKLKNRNKLNIKRKALHVAFGLFFATLNQLIPRTTFLPGMTFLTTGTLIMELMRFRKGFGWMNDALHTCLGSALRKQEMQGKFTGSFYYFLGITACAYSFPRNAATLGICQLALADPSASYFGQKTRHVYWSRIENGLGGFGRNKGFLGFLGGALVCVPFNYRMLSIAKWGAAGVPGGNNAILIASLALGVAGAFADLAVPTPAITMPKTILGVPVPPFHVDDNFVVPIFSAFACTKIFNYLGWSQELELGRFLFF